MRGLIKNVAGVIGDLQTLNLLEEKNVTSTIELNEQTAKYILNVKVVGTVDVLELCLEMFQSLRKDGYVMSIKENNKNDPLNSELAVKFYE